MKFTSMSKAALAAMLVAGTLAASPVLANADSSSDPVTVTTDQGNHQKVSVSVKNNDDGSKTVTVTMPKDQVVGHADSKGNTFTAKTDPDSDNKTNVDTGKVSVNGDNAKFKIELDQSAVENGDLMDTPLQIDITDNQGHHVGKISNVTLNQLIQQANKQKADANSSSKASSESSASSTSSSSASNSSQSSSSAKSTAGNNATSNDNDTQTSGVDTNNGGQNNGGQTTTATENGATSTSSSSNSNDSQRPAKFDSVAAMLNYAKQHGENSIDGAQVTTSVKNCKNDGQGTNFDGDNGVRFRSGRGTNYPSIVGKSQVTVTIQGGLETDPEVGNDQYAVHYTYDENANDSSNSSNGQPGNTNNGSQNGTNQNGTSGQGNAGSNGSVPQTGDQHSVLGVIAGGITSGLGMLGEFFSKKLF